MGTTENSLSDMTVRVNKIYWERVQITFEGEFTAAPKGTYDFYLKNYTNGVGFKLDYVTINDNTFSVRINIIIAYKQSVIPDGDWFLEAVDSDGNEIHVKYNPALYDKNLLEYDNMLKEHMQRIPSKGGDALFILPRVNIKNDDLYLQTYFKKRIKLSLLQRLRKRVFVMLVFLDNLFFKCEYYFFKLFKRGDKKTLLFTSDSRGSLSGNMEFIYEEMLERELDKEYRIKMLFKPCGVRKRGLKNRLSMPYYLATSDIVIVDDFHPMLYKVKLDKSVKIIQLWHACGAFKTVGFSRVGKPGGLSLDADNHKNYTYAIVSSEHSVKYYAEAFGLQEKKVIPTGIPRMDVFFDEEYRKKICEAWYNKYPNVKKADKVILFAPTFRGIGAKTAYYPMEKIDFNALGKYCKNNNAVIIVKMHPFVKTGLKLPEKYKKYFIDANDYREVNDILFITDLLITDYSSVIYEYSTLNKPMLFYAFDLEDYISSRDFYEPYEDFVPGKIVRTFEQLMTSIKDKDYEYEKVEVFRNKNFKYFDSHSTDRVIDWLILDKEIDTK